jgi:hypothetical protein
MDDDSPATEAPAPVGSRLEISFTLPHDRAARRRS